MSNTKHSNLKLFLDTNQPDNSHVQKIDNARYIFTLPQPIVLSNEDKHQITLGVEAMSLPITCYTVNSTNNALYINDTSIVLTHGNYNIQIFIDHVNQLLGTLATITFNDINSKITFTSSTALKFPTSPQSSAHRLFGITTSSIAKPLIYECENGVALVYSQSVTVRINNISTLNMDTNGSGSLLRLPINTSSFTVLSHVSSNPFMTTISSKSLTQLDVSLIDDDNNLLQIQNHPWFIVLRVEFELATSYYMEKSKIQTMRNDQLQASSKLEPSEPIPQTNPFIKTVNE